MNQNQVIYNAEFVVIIFHSLTIQDEEIFKNGSQTVVFQFMLIHTFV